MNTRYTEDINQVLIERKILTPDASILVSISGGQDSIFLFYLLYHLKCFWNWELAVIHCDHKWHPGSRNHARSLYSLAAKMRISSYTAIPTQQLTKNENQAREWRYLIIRRIADTHSYTDIALGHNGSDRVETLLAHGLRGAGLQGLNSLNWKRWIPITFDFPIRITPEKVKRFYYKSRYYWASSSMNARTSIGITLVRPLLNLTRAEIRYEVNKKGYPLCIDPSNYHLGFQRNRIRHQLLPYLRKYFNPNIDSILRNLTEILEFEVLYIDSIVETLYQKSCTTNKEKNESSFQFSLTFWRALPIAIQRRMLKKIVNVYGLSSFNFNQIENIRLDLNQPKHLFYRKIILSKGLVLKITSTKFMIQKNLDIL